MALGVLAWRFLAPGGPAVDGQPLARWIKQPNRQAMDLVDRAPAFPPDAAPVLARFLTWNPNPVERALNHLHRSGSRWDLTPLHTRFGTGEPADIRAYAGWGLTCMGPAAAEVFPSLERVVSAADTNVSTTLGLALIAIAPGDNRAVDPLQRLLANPLAAPTILPALRRGPPLPRSLLPDLLRIATNRLAGQDHAFELLAPFGPDASAAAPVLMESLARGLPTSRSTAAMHRIRYIPLLELLAGLGPAAVRPHRDQLLDWTTSGRIPIPHNVIRVLGPEAAGFAPLLRRELDAPPTLRPVPLDQMLAEVSLAAIDGRPAGAVPALIRALRHRSMVDPSADYSPLHPRLQLGPLGPITFDHRHAALWLLGELGPDAAEALPALRAALSEDHGWLPVLAARAIWRVRQDPAEALPALSAALASMDPYRRYLAMVVCEEMGPETLRQARERAQSTDARLRLAFPVPAPGSPPQR